MAEQCGWCSSLGGPPRRPDPLRSPGDGVQRPRRDPGRPGPPPPRAGVRQGAQRKQRRPPPAQPRPEASSTNEAARFTPGPGLLHRRHPRAAGTRPTPIPSWAIS